ncbi:hypothetical protein ONE63_003435 [Megalurothrips usitatus]|uniref:JmjC domain-containing protein n=1 Tax=Megalurothrips usitatus TaxID=439358 RepID=A0AAV7X798_9NEOP|nr:hypothetical protein ONE63_003435 [Megalurothrips usitatus]
MWTDVKLDPGGVPTVFVTDDHMRDFPKFMDHVIREKIGIEMGCFKVVGLVSSTTLEDLCAFAREYLLKLRRPQGVEVIEGNKFAYPVRQSFYFGSHSEHLYGSQQRICTPAQFSSFVQKVSETETFKTSPCCENALSKSVLDVEAHFWNVIGPAAAKSSGLGKSFSKSSVNALLEKAAEVRRMLDPYSKNIDFKTESFESVSLRRSQKKSISKCDPILCCPGIPLDNKAFPITSGFDLSNLGTLLDCHREKYPGLAHPYLYIASNHASFAWHIKEKALFSANILHFGAPSVWFVAGPRHFKKFSEVAKLFPLDPGQVSCASVLMHKYLMVSRDLLAKHGIPVQAVIQRQNEIIITYPYASHAGFHTGWNISQAVKFADPWPSQITMDIKEMIAVVRPDLLVMYMKRDYTNLALAVADNQFLKILGTLPFLNPSKDTGANVWASPAEEGESGKGLSNKEKSEMVNSSHYKGGRYVLHCPKKGCPKTLEGGRCHIPRMVAHIRKKHSTEPDLMLWIFREIDVMSSIDAQGFIVSPKHCSRVTPAGSGS